MKLFAGLLAVAFVLLQYRLWMSDEGIREVWQLRDAVAQQAAENSQLAERNNQLKAEVQDLKQGLTALEERARHDLGMVGPRETFYQVVDGHDLPGLSAQPAPVTTQAASR